jgi:hypothetical protein
MSKNTIPLWHYGILCVDQWHKLSTESILYSGGHTTKCGKSQGVWVLQALHVTLQLWLLFVVRVSLCIHSASASLKSMSSLIGRGKAGSVVRKRKNPADSITSGWCYSCLSLGERSVCHNATLWLYWLQTPLWADCVRLRVWVITLEWG